jgi:TPR repeat protein
VWPVRAILDNVQTNGVQLRDKSGTPLVVIQRSWVAQVDKVTGDLASAYHLAAPRAFIMRQNGPNAFVTLDHGTPIMVVNTDMLRMVGDDRDLMAVVVGHELGHLQAGHLTQGHEIQSIIAVVGLIAGAALDIKEARRGVNTGGLGQVAGGTTAALVNAKFSRNQEREADDLGIRAMARAGYDPQAAPRLWKMMEDLGGGGDGLWFSSHPTSAERYETLSALAASMGGTYAANRPPEKELPHYSDPYPPARYGSLEPTLDEMSADPIGPYARGRALWKEGQLEEAFPLLKQAAEAGDDRALMGLADFEQNGRLGPPDIAKARADLETAASHGLGAAIVALGAQSFDGKGWPRDYQEAARLFSIAAARGEPRGYAELAFLYLEDGKPFPRDPALARQLAEKAAGGGDPASRALLGVMLREGIGGATDKSRSFALLTLAASDNKMASFAQYHLGVSYELGAGTPANKDKAIELYRLAASHNYQLAAKRLDALQVSH